MNELTYVNFGFFGLCTLLVVVGGLITVAARNPIRGAIGLLTTIVGIAGMYLLLSAEFLAAVQIIVYAGAVVVLFLFVIMLLGPSSMSGRDTRTWSARYLAAAVFLLSSVVALVLLARVAGPTTAFGPPARGLGTIEGIGHELFTTALGPFELSSALLLVAVVGAVAVARGKQPDPTVILPPHSAGGEAKDGALSTSGGPPGQARLPPGPPSTPAKEHAS